MTDLPPALGTRLSDFDFELPEDRIAAQPATPRDSAKLLRVRGGTFEDRIVRELPSLLRPGDLMIVNDTKVVPARLLGRRGEVAIEILLNKPEAEDPYLWSALARPAKRLKEGQSVRFAPDFAAEVAQKRADGTVVLRFDVSGAALFEALAAHGHVPLPPYIKRHKSPSAEDRAQYQTVYAAQEGAVAAPTAGLHFTPELLAALDKAGVARAAVTLHVGAGTFLPVKAERVAEHKMHAEWGALSPETAAQINATREKGGRIVAVGTTSLRLIETAAGADGAVRPFVGETDIFITPGYRFNAVDVLMTNFHLPKSTLFMLVSAFSGFSTMRAAYDHALANAYRFYSYGDACLLEPNP